MRRFVQVWRIGKQMASGLRIGLLGCGFHGRTRLTPALKAAGMFELVACADPDETALKSAQEYGYAKPYLDYKEMLRREKLDGVVVATPHHLLKDACLAVIQSGRQLFVEKPASVNKAQAVEVREAAKKAGVSVMVGFCIRFNPSRALVKSLLERGAVGQLVQVSAGKGAGPLKTWNARLETGGGELLWHGVHITDQVLWMVGDRAQRVYAEINWHPETGADRDTAYSVRFANGVMANFVVTQSLATPFDYVELIGTKGRIRAEWPSEVVHVYSQVLPEYSHPSTLVPTLPNYNVMYDVQMKAWGESVLGKKAPPIGIDAAVDTLGIIDAVFESGRKGLAVTVS